MFQRVYSIISFRKIFIICIDSYCKLNSFTKIFQTEILHINLPNQKNWFILDLIGILFMSEPHFESDNFSVVYVFICMFITVYR